MKSIFEDNRQARVLQYFNRMGDVAVASLASKLGVSERTIRNDIKRLNADLADCAVIEGSRGTYSLRVFDSARFRAALADLMDANEFADSARSRMDYVFGRLMRSEVPLVTDDLAYEMNVGRTTLVATLKRLREELESFGLEVEGRTSKGLLLRGSEYDIRKYVLEVCYDRLYRDYPLDPEIADVISETFRENSLERAVRADFERFVTLMLDRFLTGHFIGELTGRYYNLTARPEFAVVDDLVNRIGDILRVRIPVEEKLFAMLPIIGMRTPADLAGVKLIELDDSVRELGEKIFRQIQAEMDLTVGESILTEEFLYHLMFMVNRLRFGVRLKNPMREELEAKYPLANKMGDIAARVVADELGIDVTEDERGYLAAYFGVFLMEGELKQEHPFRVAVVCGANRITARLIAAQLKGMLDSSAVIDIIPDGDPAETSAALDGSDIVLTTLPSIPACDRPIIHITEILDERELLQKIERAKYWDKVDVPMLDTNCPVIAGFLDEDRFFVIEGAASYDDALERMVGALAAADQLDEGFLERLREREAAGSMVFGESAAVPHGMQRASERIVLAVGVLPEPVAYRGRVIRLIFLVGLPEHIELDDMLLIHMYDEILSIARDDDLVERIAGAKDFRAFLHALF